MSSLREKAPVQVGEAMIRRAGDDHLMAFAAGIAFRAFLTIFPALILVISIFGLVADRQTVEDAVEQVATALPSEAATLLREQMLEIATAQASSALTLSALASVLVALWAMAGGARTVMEAMNVMHDVDDTRSFLHKYLASIGLSLALVALMLVAFAATILGGPIAQSLGDQLGLGSAALATWAVLRWVLAAAFVVGALALLYRVAPNREMPWRYVMPGVAFAAVGWIAFSALFSWYVSSFGSYNATYGALAGIVLFLLYALYVSAIVLLGAELERVLEERGRGSGGGVRERARGARRAVSAG